ncbi:MAG: DNA mismatch repair protein MutS [Clostridium sp.]|jgi:DNA mismatch repair protein MutS|nr:DNA mismatch repair protein MutS [Clostridium sp.]
MDEYLQKHWHQLTPMMQQYIETKNQRPDCILFYRLGDFYEMFFEDAKIVSKELELTLTGKSCGLEERAPMCGVPYHAAEAYVNRLVQKGFKVAICDQMEDARFAKGLVKREVTRVITSGTNVDLMALDETKNQYILCAFASSRVSRYGLAVADVSTGAFALTQCDNLQKLLDELAKYEPREILGNEAFYQKDAAKDVLRTRFQASLETLPDHLFTENSAHSCILRHFKTASLSGLGVLDFPLGVLAAGALLAYLYDTQKIALEHFTHLAPYRCDQFMLLDGSSRRNLELTQTMREKTKQGSLLWVLDKTRTAMGARTLRTWIEAPLLDLEAIEKRLDAVEQMCQDPIGRDEIREYLSAIYDLERLLTRISYKSANPRDLIAFAQSLSMIPPIKSAMTSFTAEAFTQLYDQLDDLSDVSSLIRTALVDEPPIGVREGGMIRDGYDETIDHLRHAKSEGKNWLAQLEDEDRLRTGIKNLKIKYNKVFGYYFEVTNSYQELVPPDYIRKQTLANAERYTTTRLKELEDTILNAQDKLYGLEYDLFVSLRETIEKELPRIQRTAKAVALMDVYASLALVAEQNHYIRPLLTQDGVIDIKEGRHPVVEQMTKHDLFIPNDTYLDKGKHNVAIITGPNMAGKSTYMRQSALLVLMAQIGSFVPASSASIGIVDRIFTRVGASDDLASGQSTFMVEMNEVANILRNATADSLLILDEIGRGTSTFDGLSIAWAVIEHISNARFLGAKTLFATHYHELTNLEGRVRNVENYCITVKESGDDIVFLRKIKKGGADKSYGIQVAKLAGIPQMVIERAKEIMQQLEDQDALTKVSAIEVATDVRSTNHEQTNPAQAPGNPKKEKVREKKANADPAQMTFLETMTNASVIRELESLDMNILRPIDAFQILNDLSTKVKNRFLPE